MRVGFARHQNGISLGRERPKKSLFGLDSNGVTANSLMPRVSTDVRPVLLVAGPAGAATFLAAPVRAIGFSGYYATGNWTINASVTVSGAAPNNTITLRGKDNGGGASDTTFTIVADPLAPVASTVRFNWEYVKLDRDDSSFDPFGHVLNGNFFQLTPTDSLIIPPNPAPLPSSFNRAMCLALISALLIRDSGEG